MSKLSAKLSLEERTFAIRISHLVNPIFLFSIVALQFYLKTMQFLCAIC